MRREILGPWGTPVAANITPTGIGHDSDAELAAIITTGTRPDGSKLMPIWAYAKIKPDDVSAIILYLRSLPPKP